jgi:hypothetical protein
MQIRFDKLPGGPGDEARFIEAENDDGESVKLEWRMDGESDWLLIIPSDDELRAEVERLRKDRDDWARMLDDLLSITADLAGKRDLDQVWEDIQTMGENLIVIRNALCDEEKG